jgi:hypothetical protein
MFCPIKPSQEAPSNLLSSFVIAEKSFITLTPSGEDGGRCAVEVKPANTSHAVNLSKKKNKAMTRSPN